SGSRSLLDRLLLRGGVPSAAVTGYNREAGGHLSVASTVASGQADAGVGVQAAATALGLGFVPLEEERYDLVIPNHFLNHSGVQVLLDLLRQPGLRRRVETLGGYDVSAMGIPVSHT
ncbi:MAG TPA: XRE family transcriptional regulator, partial [Dehalococcoidia bacterium]|nr:XRE family transcriptional regulator [Dehalococcoidia bacterium]